MSMRLVPSPVRRPNRCAFIPFLGASNERRGFFTAGTEIMAMDGHVYCSFTAFEAMAKIAGYAPLAGRAPLEAEVAGLRAEAERRDAEIAVLREQLAAVEVLKAGGFSQARRPGRPKSKPKAKVAA